MVALPATIDPNAPLPGGMDMLTAASTPVTPNLIPLAPPVIRNDGRIRRATGFRRAPMAARVLQPGRAQPRVVHHLPGVPGAIPGQAPRFHHGATQYWRSNDLLAQFASMATRAANTNSRPRNNRALALLSAAGARARNPWGVLVYAPQAEYLYALNSRLQAERAFRHRMAATLTARFNEDAIDMADGHADIPRTLAAQERGWNPPQLKLA